MKYLKKFIKIQASKKIFIIGAVIFAILCSVVFGLAKYRFFKSETVKIGFENIGELVTQSAYCKEVNLTDANRKLFGIEIPFTQSKYIYSYGVTIKAGFDFSEIEWELSESSISVKLPETKVLSCEIDMNSFEIYHEKESIFRRISMEETNDDLKSLKQKAEESAIENGLLENARANAETILKGFFANVYDLEVYTINFVDK